MHLQRECKFCSFAAGCGILVYPHTFPQTPQVIHRIFPMKFDVVLDVDTLSQIRETSRAAEALGFDGIWAPETRHDPFPQLALVAEHTQRVELGPAIAVAFARSPMHMAYVAWDLARYSEGRFILGLGTQIKPHIERRFAMPWSKPAARLREYILALKHIWQGWQNNEQLNFRGEFYKMTLMSPFFNPGPIENPNIPIYIAGVNQRLCELAGELCDGFHVHPFHTVDYLRERIRPWVAAGAEKAGRRVEDVVFSTTVFAIVGDTEQDRARRREEVRQQIAFYASTPSYRPVLEQRGWGEIGDRLGKLAVRKEWAAMPALISDAMVDAFAI
ncbi:MAG TPA: TIGR03617 family F420-dependent LLM class oxidoreductase, partial [Anaerolineae bacterium]|nr:TIGR03617 family F420-dependent LLM class oxidoreductase [Anaerolineae bacterium]